jgi:hypothetical protein
MPIDQQQIKQFISQSLLENFPELQPVIEPKIKKKVEIKEREVKVAAPIVSPDVPKVQYDKFFF